MAALLQVSKCPVVDIRAPEVMPHCPGHVHTALCYDMKVCLPQENRKTWIKWARTYRSGDFRRE